MHQANQVGLCLGFNFHLEQQEEIVKEFPEIFDKNPASPQSEVEPRPPLTQAHSSYKSDNSEKKHSIMTKNIMEVSLKSKKSSEGASDQKDSTPSGYQRYKRRWYQNKTEKQITNEESEAEVVNQPKFESSNQNEPEKFSNKAVNETDPKQLESEEEWVDYSNIQADSDTLNQADMEAYVDEKYEFEENKEDPNQFETENLKYNPLYPRRYTKQIVQDIDEPKFISFSEFIKDKKISGLKQPTQFPKNEDKSSPSKRGLEEEYQSNGKGEPRTVTRYKGSPAFSGQDDISPPSSVLKQNRNAKYFENLKHKFSPVVEQKVGNRNTNISGGSPGSHKNSSKRQQKDYYHK